MATYSVRAYNTATASANKMHDNEVAKTFGFRGGLVPGVDVYAYLTHLPAERWGRDWLARGQMYGRFVTPVYDGDEVTVTSTDDGDGVIGLTLVDSSGNVCATGSASIDPGRVDGAPSADVDALAFPWVDAQPVVDRPLASAEVLDGIEVLGAYDAGFHADKATAYLADVREALPLYAKEGIAHPGWLLRTANGVLTANVRLGPWIHVSSATRHLSTLHDGEHLSTRARVIATSERKGHRFVELDVVMFAAADRPVARVHHTAIYQPRETQRPSIL